MRKYGARHRGVFNHETRTVREVYSPVIYKQNGKIVFISENGEIMEFDDRNDAIKQAKETYDILKSENVDWIR